jgi:hypothetical protein
MLKIRWNQKCLLKALFERIVFILYLTPFTAKYFKYFLWARYFKCVE